jgi:hypothetical protein
MAPARTEATDRLLNELRALALPPGQYAVFGSGPMGVRGLREIRDVDVIVSASLFAELSLRYGAQEHAHGLNKIQVGNVELLDGWYPDVGALQTLIDEADWIDGLPFVKLAKVLEWKEKFGRSKDGPDIETIKAHLRAIAQ